MGNFLQGGNMTFVLLALILIAMMWYSNRGRKKMAERQAQMERDMNEKLVPGAWVKTAVGFWGRFVDQDGDIVVLETIDGTEMYWDRQMIRSVGDEPPFASDEPAVELTEEEPKEPILGLDDPATDDASTDEKN